MRDNHSGVNHGAHSLACEILKMIDESERVPAWKTIMPHRFFENPNDRGSCWCGWSFSHPVHDITDRSNPGVTINLKHNVRFALTPEGERVMRDRDAELTRRLKAVTGTDFDWFKFHPADEDGTRTEQLWELFQVFGPSMFMSSPPVFVNNNLEWRQEDQP